MTNKRQIRGQQYDVKTLVENAITTVDAQELNTEAARAALLKLGHTNPDEKLVIRYARESAILAKLAQGTGANFNGQIGKIDFSTTERAIDQVNSYLNRRINGQRRNYTERRNH